MNKSSESRRVQVLAVVTVAVLGLLLFAVDRKFAQPQRHSYQCQQNLKEIGFAMFAYAQDHNGTFPLASNWMEALRPYLKSPSLLQCPARPDLPFGYAMNPRLSGLKMTRLLSPTEIAMVFDSDVGHLNAVDWRTTVAPLSRHYSGISIVWADGHCYGRQTKANFTKITLRPNIKEKPKQ